MFSHHHPVFGTLLIRYYVGMDKQQVSNWFANARKRKWRPLLHRYGIPIIQRGRSATLVRNFVGQPGGEQQHSGQSSTGSNKRRRRYRRCVTEDYTSTYAGESQLPLRYWKEYSSAWTTTTSREEGEEEGETTHDLLEFQPSPEIVAPQGGVTTTPSAVQILKSWLLSPDHIQYPYPTAKEIAALCHETGCSVQQVKHWFARQRSQLRKSKDTDPRRSMIHPKTTTRNRTARSQTIDVGSIRRPMNMKDILSQEPMMGGEGVTPRQSWSTEKMKPTMMRLPSLHQLYYSAGSQSQMCSRNNSTNCSTSRMHKSKASAFP